IRCEKTVVGGSAVATTTATASARSSQAKFSRRAGQRAVELTVTLPRPRFAGVYVARPLPARRVVSIGPVTMGALLACVIPLHEAGPTSYASGQHIIGHRGAD